jgi:predicted nucleic acid-binding protein
MANFYFDSSAVVKYYHDEVGSSEVIRLVGHSDARHYISRLTFIELHSAFGGKVRSGHITPDQFAMSCERLRRDVFERRFRVLPMKALHYREGERLLRAYTAEERPAHLGFVTARGCPRGTPPNGAARPIRLRR